MATTKPQQTAQETGAAFSLDTAAVLAEESTGEIAGRSPWFLAWRRLRRNYVALGFLAVFVVIVAACFMAPLYAHHVAHTGPNDNHITDNVKVGGVNKPSSRRAARSSIRRRTSFASRPSRFSRRPGGRPTGSSSSARTATAGTWR